MALKRKCKELGASDDQLGHLMGKPAALTLAYELSGGSPPPEPAASPAVRIFWRDASLLHIGQALPATCLVLYLLNVHALSSLTPYLHTCLCSL